MRPLSENFLCLAFKRPETIVVFVFAIISTELRHRVQPNDGRFAYDFLRRNNDRFNRFDCVAQMNIATLYILLNRRCLHWFAWVFFSFTIMPGLILRILDLNRCSCVCSFLLFPVRCILFVVPILMSSYDLWAKTNRTIWPHLLQCSFAFFIESSMRLNQHRLVYNVTIKLHFF